MRNPTLVFRRILIALTITLMLSPSVVHALASSESFALTSATFVASSPLTQASSSNGNIRLLGSFVEAGTAAGQSASDDSGILMSNGWATVPIPVPEPGLAGLLFAGLILLIALLGLHNRRSPGTTRAVKPVSGWSLVLLLFLLVLPVPAFAVPYDFSYQGTLANASGDPLEGSVDISIGLFGQMVASAGEVALYSEDHSGTSLSEDGGFSLMIGTGTVTTGSFGPSLFQTNNVYLEITVDGEVLSPRQPISSVPWAMVAEELADESDLVNQVGDLEDQIGSFPADGDIGSELASLSNALSAVQTQLVSLSDSSASVQGQLAATASQITSVYNQIGNPLTSSQMPTGGLGSGIGIYDFSTWMTSAGNPLIALVDEGMGGIMTADEYTLGLIICNDPNCDSATAAWDLAYGHVDSWTTCMEWEEDPETGETWCMMEEEEYGPNTLEFPQVIEGSDGFPLISFTDPVANTLKFVHCNNADCEGLPDAVPPDTVTPTTSSGGAVQGNGSDMALGSDGLAVVSYYSTATGLIFLRCLDTGCNSQATQTIDATVGASWSHRSSIAVGSDGMPVVAYYHGADQDVGFAHCGTLSCGAGTTTVILDSVGDVGKHPVVAIGATGFPSVAYHDDTNSAIKLVTCNDLACATSSAETIATSVTGLRKISLQFSELGMPTISWTDTSADEVRVVSCPSPDCSTKGSQQTWVTEARDQNLLLNGEGDPVVVYVEKNYPTSIRVSQLNDLSTQVVSNESAAGTAQSTASSALGAANSSQTAADDAQAAADSAQADVDALTSPGCGTNYALQASACPLESADNAGYNAILNCSDAPMGSLCEGDGECGTDTNLDNCGMGFDLYYKGN
ncbi:MAG: hypothetical protein VX252_12205 [Myxococcota bacterium]|nr:hypothetical protein [Myxococcota bacterium]